ncbi:MAG: ATP-binding cassette domain-containing protein, partial [Nitrospinota bacterium]
YQNAFNIGVVFGQRSQLWWDIPLRESFSILKKIYRVDDENYQKRVKELMDSLSLTELLDTPVRKLSLGQRMRCELAASLVHNPPLLFLDEPTIGLDVVAKEKIREFLKYLNRNYGTTIILTTHDMNDIEQLCNRLIIIDKGKIIYDGSKDELKKDFIHDKLIEVEFAGEFTSLSNLPELVLVNEFGPKKCFVFKKDKMNISELIEKLVKDHSIKDLSVRDPSLEVIIKAIYEEGSSYLPRSVGSL